MESPLVAAALRYAADGHPVLPLYTVDEQGACSCGTPDCSSAGKHPATPNGLCDATTDRDRIREWWRSTAWNIGLRCDGLLVLDFDGEPGQDWHEGLAVLEHSHGELPDTRSQRTGSGEHLIYRLPEGVEIGNSTAALRAEGVEDVDVRSGAGAYIVAAPSQHVTGAPYTMNEKPITNAPPQLLELLQTPAPTPRPSPTTQPTFEPDSGSRYGRAALQGLVAEMSRAEPGTRNMTLNETAFKAGQLAAGGELDAAHAEGALTEAALQTGLTEREIRQTIASGFRAGATSPRSRPESPATPTAANESRRWLTIDEVLAEPLAPTPWTVEGLIQPGTVGMLAGLPKTYKSFLALEIAFSVATGEPLLDEYAILDSGPVLYVWQDDSRQNMHARIHGLAQAYESRKPSLHFLLNGGCRLPENAEMFGEQVVARGAKLLVLDSFYNFVSGVDMRGEESLPAINALKKVADETGAGILIVDHSRKPTDGSPARGSYGSVFKQAAVRWGISTEPAGEHVALTSFTNNGPVLLNRQHVELDAETLRLRLVDTPTGTLDDTDYEERVYAHVDQHPDGASRNELIEQTRGKAQNIRAALDRLIEQELVFEFPASQLGREGSARICFSDRNKPSVPQDTD